ncbi:MAG: archaellin/type IV pilin N-terminal domain-containing protein [Nitrososphaeria archaeon]
MRQKRKAISPIIATLILIVITVIAGIFLYGFVSGYMSTLSGGTNQPPPNLQFTASKVGFTSSTSKPANALNITFVIYNDGTTAVTFQSSASLINASSGIVVGIATVFPNNPSSSLTVPPNSIIYISVKYSNSPPAGNYYVKFTTTSGYTIQSPTVYVS